MGLLCRYWLHFAPDVQCAVVQVNNPGLVCKVLSKSDVKHREQPRGWLGPAEPHQRPQIAMPARGTLLPSGWGQSSPPTPDSSYQAVCQGSLALNECHSSHSVNKGYGLCWRKRPKHHLSNCIVGVVVAAMMYLAARYLHPPLKSWTVHPERMLWKVTEVQKLGPDTLLE